MKILVFSEFTASTVAGNLGRPEYSYYFILEKYLPILSSLGEVVFIHDPAAEVDPNYDAALASGSTAVFLSFTPPHRTPKNLRCPTICVLAWEFDSIPDEDWDPEEPWYNWVTAIREIGNVITISDYATKVIQAQVGPGPRVVTIPAPVVSSASDRQVDGETDISPSPGGRAARPDQQRLCLTAGVIDSQAMDITTDSATPRMSNPELLDYGQKPWDGHAVHWCFSAKSDTAGQYLVGFYAREEWGCWSKTASPCIILPWSISGDVELTLEMVGYGENRGRLVEVVIGEEAFNIELQSELHEHTLSFHLKEPANSIHILGLSAVPAPGARDHRNLGLGLSNLWLCRPASVAIDTTVDVQEEHRDDIVTESETELSFRGTVYTSVFNPDDGRKNWQDIVTAFCWAFRDDPDKTLVLKMSHHNRATFLGKLLLLFSQLSPFQCRIVAIHGFLSEQQMQGLMGVTDFFVNASLAEGQCLPLLEFMAEGVPAISPDHTAMATYINARNSFVVKSSHQPHVWPTDPRNPYRTLSYRIDWHSLYCAYIDSAAVQKTDQALYAAMSTESMKTVREFYCAEKIALQLQQFLVQTARSAR